MACDTHLQCRSWKLRSCLSRGHRRQPADGRLAAGQPSTSHHSCSRNLENALLLATPVNTIHIRLILKRQNHLMCDVVSTSVIAYDSALQQQCSMQLSAVPAMLIKAFMLRQPPDPFVNNAMTSFALRAAKCTWSTKRCV